MPFKNGSAARRLKVLVTTAREKTSQSAINSAVDSFEPLFFNNLVVVSDGFFVHRSRTIEKKDANL